MKKKNKILRFFKLLYIKLCRINDSPQKVAQGLGIGVFLGVMPGVGLIAALIMASILKVNKAAAGLGALFTNTWSSFIIFVFSLRTGSLVLNQDWRQVNQDWNQLLKNFHFVDILQISVLKIIFPIVIGYIILSACLGITAYSIALITIPRIRKFRKK